MDHAARMPAIEGRKAFADPRSAAGALGLGVGDRLATIDRTQVRGLRHLESLLMQSGRGSLLVGLRAANDDAAPLRQVELPRP